MADVWPRTPEPTATNADPCASEGVRVSGVWRADAAPLEPFARQSALPVVPWARYVLGGFIAVSDKVEHVRRLNERGNRLLLLPSPTTAELERAARLFAYGLRLNPDCSLCHANRGDALLRLQRPVEAEAEQRAQIALLPRDSDARFALGVALRAQGRTEDAVEAYRSALAIQPRDFDAWINLAAALADLRRFSEEVRWPRRATRGGFRAEVFLSALPLLPLRRFSEELKCPRRGRHRS